MERVQQSGRATLRVFSSRSLWEHLLHGEGKNIKYNRRAQGDMLARVPSSNTLQNTRGTHFETAGVW